jgi:Zn-dependent protease with chaperone function
MPFLLLLVLTFICLQRDWPAPLGILGPFGGALATWTLVGLVWLVAGRLTRELDRALRDRSISCGELARRLAWGRRRLLYAQMVGLILALGLLGWGAVVKSLWQLDGKPLPGLELLILSPLLVGLLCAWARYYELERALQDPALPEDAEPFPSRAGYLAAQARQNLILIAPPIILLFIQQCAFWLFPSLQYDELLLPLFGVGLLCAVFVLIPWVLRLLLGLEPLPPSPLRDRLFATAGRLGLRISDILVWKTRNTIANAMVTGPLPCLRYVILTDRLIRDLEPDEIEAVFGHEVGHVKHHHMLFYFSFMLSSLMVAVVLWNATTGMFTGMTSQGWFEASWFALDRSIFQFVLQGLLVSVLAAYVFVVFGFLSRRCERQADVFGCRTVSCATFIGSLEKVARLNGISRDQPGWLSSWQHSTIARRVAFLERMSRDPRVEFEFQRRVGLVKCAALMALGAALVVLGIVFGPGQVWASLKQL